MLSVGGAGAIAGNGAVGGTGEITKIGAIGIDSGSGATTMAAALALSAARFLASIPNAPVGEWLLPLTALRDELAVFKEWRSEAAAGVGSRHSCFGFFDADWILSTMNDCTEPSAGGREAKLPWKDA
jgi:hypothetical protein